VLTLSNLRGTFAVAGALQLLAAVLAAGPAVLARIDRGATVSID
jgi:hypothetical protein